MEAPISIGNTQLTDAQSITVRVALNSFKMDLGRSGLGNDETSLGITQGYLSCLDEILQLIHEEIEKERKCSTTL